MYPQSQSQRTRTMSPPEGTPSHTILAERLFDSLRQQTVTFQGNPVALLAAVDNFCVQQPMMHIGPQKGKIVRDIVTKLAPKVCLELGTYCGYSAVAMTSALPPNSRFLTVEGSSKHAALSEQFVSWSGPDTQAKITVIHGNSDEVIPRLRDEYGVDTLDLVFLDHMKSYYLRDLKLLESLGLMREGTAVLADNLIIPGAPDFLEYLKTSPRYKMELIEATDANSGLTDAVANAVYLG